MISYRVMKGSPILQGERIPRWAMPSLVIRDGRSMRYQYAGRLKENDQVYLFISPAYSKLLDRIFASQVPVDEDDAEFLARLQSRRPGPPRSWTRPTVPACSPPTSRT